MNLLVPFSFLANVYRAQSKPHVSITLLLNLSRAFCSSASDLTEIATVLLPDSNSSLQRTTEPSSMRSKQNPETLNGVESLKPLPCP